MSKILRVNMTDLTARFEDVPEKYRLTGGRGLTSSITCDEVPPTCHPLGPNNKITFAVGIVAGTSAPTSGRISIGGKSPLTGTIKETNSGGMAGQKLARLGLKAIIVEGQPKEKGKLWLLKVDKAGAQLQPADGFTSKGLYETYPMLFKKFSDKVAIIGIGTSGERLMSMAGICVNDPENRPSRYAGRGGMGAVMGSKGLKAIILDDAGGPGVPIANKEAFDAGRKKLVAALREHDITKPGGALNTTGTATLINVIDEAGALPTRNFSDGRFEGANKISGETLKETCEKRGGVGMVGHSCSPGCIIKCSNVYPRPDGTEHVSVQEYESIWALGANCGIDSLDATGELIRLCNDYGVDTIEAGVTIGVAMEAGLAKFGDSQKAIELMHEIGQGTPLGHILGSGAAATASTFGVVRCPTVKGQAMPAYEPRPIKGIGIIYATSTMGADHTAGYTIAPEILDIGGSVDKLVAEKSALARHFLHATAYLFDSTGHCLFISFAVLDNPSGLEGVVEECNGVLGTSWTVDDVLRMGGDIVKKERAFNKAAGFTSVDDRLPEFMKYEKLPPHNVAFDVPDTELDKTHDS
ncbi:MAG: aldehyde ferredoxin oxidoreductase [Dehalococcoidales bacterium]|nr:aldehyde ferredoxin oxidoreductase [Dehalococcoidales bacterium]MDP6576995.1 aldehyde ferredoxin oxidoreductase C-terminal domain-containing protein [Dehalococcoidales bacterium]MDP6825296.1 aldehyde ferredoxin oxidoreductase C-terminal domain-containing protein [Dehalococcoidales bacterium]